jgi:multiple sugar transport system ATP-binding protein
MTALALKNIHKQYGEVVTIKGIDLQVEPEEFIVLVGPSGCGKSTLLRMIAGLEDITSGELTIDNVRMNEVEADARGLAMVFQSYALYPHMTVADNMGFALKMAGVPKLERARKVLEAAKVLQLENLLERTPKQLSGGQRQRVAIGRAIVRHPKIFLFDEPLSNLDASLRVQMRIELAELHRKLRATMVYVTHDQTEAMTLADRIVVLRDGVIEQVGTPLELYNRPANTFVAGFIGSPKMNLVPARVVERTGDSVRLQFGQQSTVTLPAPAGLNTGQALTLTLGVRPEMVVPDAQGPIAGTVAVVEHLGGETLCYVDIGNATRLTAKLDAAAAVKVGDQIRLGLVRAGVMLFDPAGKALPSAA